MLNDRYEVLETVGKGGMGCVYRALDHREDRVVALKAVTPPPEELEQVHRAFDNEVRLLAGLEHPNLPRVYTSFVHEDGFYMVMEFIEGRTLREIVKLAPRRLALKRVQVWAAQILDCLACLHGHEPPVIMRDLTPNNVMLTTDFTVKLIDFGIARTAEPGARTMTALKGFGTPGFAPPEQFEPRAGSTDTRSDIYSLGATLYYALTGTAPESSIDRLSSHRAPADPVAQNPTVTRDVARCLEQMMDLNPRRRPTLSQVRQRLLGEDGPSRRFDPFHLRR